MWRNKKAAKFPVPLNYNIQIVNIERNNFFSENSGGGLPPP